MIPVVRGRQVMSWNNGDDPAFLMTESFGSVLNRFCVNSDTSNPAHLSPARSEVKEVDGMEVAR